MPDRIIRESWAIFCEDGSVAVSAQIGRRLDFYESKHDAVHILCNKASEMQLRSDNPGHAGPFRVDKVRLSEVEATDGPAQ